MAHRAEARQRLGQNPSERLGVPARRRDLSSPLDQRRVTLLHEDLSISLTAWSMVSD